MANVIRLLQPSVDTNNVAHKYNLGLGLVSVEDSRTEDYHIEPSKLSTSFQSVRNSMFSNSNQQQQQQQQQLHQQLEASTTHQQEVYGRVKSKNFFKIYVVHSY